MELVADILYLACSPPIETSTHAKAVYQVMSVCTLFNDVILGKPEFWTCIVIPPYDRPIDHVPLYIQRSKYLPLNIILHLRPHDHGFSRRQRFKARTRTLSGEAHRWRTLQIVMDDPWRDVTSVLPPVLPTLESLHVMSKHRHGLDQPALCIRTKFPKLESLRVDQVRLDWSTVQFENGLDALLLHDLSLDTEKWFACFGFIRSCTHLQRLQFSAVVPRNGIAVPLEPPPEQELSLPFLQDLRISTNASEITMRYLLQTLHAPELRTLSIAQVHLLTLAIVSSRWDFEGVRLQFPQLERLTLRGISGSEAVLQSFLKDLPTLTHLAVLHEYTSPSTLPLSDDRGNLLCPNLTTLVTRDIPPQVLRSALEPYALAGARVRLWTHVDDIAHSGLSGETAFEELERNVNWLKCAFNLKTTGSASTALYRSWEAVCKRMWLKHQEVGADAPEVEGWARLFT